MITNFSNTPQFRAIVSQTEYELTDSDDRTVSTGNGTASNGQPPQKLVRLNLNRASPEDIKNFPQNIAFIMQAMINDFDQVKIYPNKIDAPIEKLHNMPKFIKNFQNHFTIINDTANTNSLSFLSIVFRVESNESIRSFRENATISRILTDNNIILRPHQWHEDEKQVMTIAYVMGVDATKYKEEHLSAMISETLKAKNIQHSDIPRYQLTKRKASINHSSLKKSRTMFAIEVRTEDRLSATRFFVKHLNDKGNPSMLLPWLKNAHPKAFAMGLQFHINTTIASQWIMKLKGISFQQMSYLAKPILATLGHNDIVPTWQTKASVIWHVMVTKHEYVNTPDQFYTEIEALFYKSLPKELQIKPFESLDADENKLDDDFTSPDSLITATAFTMMEIPLPPGMTPDQYLGLSDKSLDRPPADIPLTEINLDSCPTTTIPISTPDTNPPAAPDNEKDEIIRQLKEQDAKKDEMIRQMQAKLSNFEQMMISKEPDPKPAPASNSPTESPTPRTPPRQIRQNHSPAPTPPVTAWSPQVNPDSPMDVEHATSKRSFAEIVATPTSSPAKQTKPPKASSLSKISANKTKRPPKRLTTQDKKQNRPTPIDKESSSKEEDF